MNGYELSRAFWDWSFENPEKVKPIHSAIYFFSIEHCNRLGWKGNFGFPSQMVMEAVGVKNWRTYSKALNELVDFGFIKMVEISKNQYSSNIIAIVDSTKAHTKALDKALSKHSTKHSQSTVSIDKQYNNITINNRKEQFKKSLTPFQDKYSIDLLKEFFEYWSEHGDQDKKMRFEKEKSFGVSRRLSTWYKNSKRWIDKKEDHKLTAVDNLRKSLEIQ